MMHRLICKIDISFKKNSIIQKLDMKYHKYGIKDYSISEPISVNNHSIQSARLAEKMYGVANREPLIVAALLHDVGHLLVGDNPDNPHRNPESVTIPIDPASKIDDRHERHGAYYLRELGFSPEIWEPILLHVMAKRYLCTENKDYYNNLSEGSKLSFHLQGGELTEFQMYKLDNTPAFKTAKLLRLIDDKAKDSGNSNDDSSPIREYEYSISKFLYPTTRTYLRTRFA